MKNVEIGQIYTWNGNLVKITRERTEHGATGLFFYGEMLNTGTVYLFSKSDLKPQQDPNDILKEML